MNAMPIPGSLEAHLSHQGSRASSAGCHKLGFQSAALAALATSAPGGMPPRNYAKTILSATSSLQKHSPLLPSTVWSAVQVGVHSRVVSTAPAQQSRCATTAGCMSHAAQATQHTFEPCSVLLLTAAQALQAQAERSRSRLSKGADGQLLTYLCEGMPPTTPACTINMEPQCHTTIWSAPLTAAVADAPQTRRHLSSRPQQHKQPTGL